jgi:hypothetical protein
MQATQTLPDHYQAAGAIDLSKDRRLLIILNIAGLVLLGLFGWLFLRAMIWLRPSDTAHTLTSASVSGLAEWAVYLLSILALMALHIVIHEAIHGVFFWIFTRARPRFALRLTYAYAAMPGWYIPRNKFFITTLAPFVVITILGLLLMLVTPWLLPVWFVMTINASGSVGDLLVAVWLLRHPSSSLAEDRGDSVTLFTSSMKNG